MNKATAGMRINFLRNLCNEAGLVFEQFDNMHVRVNGKHRAIDAWLGSTNGTTRDMTVGRNIPVDANAFNEVFRMANKPLLADERRMADKVKYKTEIKRKKPVPLVPAFALPPKSETLAEANAIPWGPSVTTKAVPEWVNHEQEKANSERPDIFADSRDVTIAALRRKHDELLALLKKSEGIRVQLEHSVKHQEARTNEEYKKRCKAEADCIANAKALQRARAKLETIRTAFTNE